MEVKVQTSVNNILLFKLWTLISYPLIIKDEMNITKVICSKNVGKFLDNTDSVWFLHV